MILTSRPLSTLALTALFALTAFPLAASAQTQHAHVHGQIKLDVVVEGPTVVIEMGSPLDNYVGFERAPRTDAEKKAVDDAVAQLRAADQLFKIDPTANCKLGPVTLRSAALGLGKPDAAATEGHGDLDATIAFNCTNAANRFVTSANQTYGANGNDGSNPVRNVRFGIKDGVGTPRTIQLGIRYDF